MYAVGYARKFETWNEDEGGEKEKPSDTGNVS